MSLLRTFMAWIFFLASCAVIFPANAQTMAWKLVAGQNGSFHIINASGTAVTRLVRYGDPASNRWTQRNMTGKNQWCMDGMFGGDPAPGVANRCEVWEAVTPPPPPPVDKPPMGWGEGPYPVGHPGYTTLRTTSSAGMQPRTGPYETGSFRNNCQFSHMAAIDGLLFPGQWNAGHLHTFFGAVLNDPNITVAKLLAAPSTCEGGKGFNNSLYWIPALVDSRTNKAVKPRSTNNYYKTGYRSVPGNTMRAIPQGLRVIAGKGVNKALPSDYDAVYEWKCFENGQKMAHGGIPTNCGTNMDVLLVIRFPQCWDGVYLASPDFKGHMAYGTPGVGCPSTHPIGLPELSMNIHYREEVAGESQYWRLSSDMYTPGPGEGWGYTAHGDVFWVWNQQLHEGFMNYCNRVNMDCHNHLIGPNLAIY